MVTNHSIFAIYLKINELEDVKRMSVALTHVTIDFSGSLTADIEN